MPDDLRQSERDLVQLPTCGFGAYLLLRVAGITQRLVRPQLLQMSFGVDGIDRTSRRVRPVDKLLRNQVPHVTHRHRRRFGKLLDVHDANASLSTQSALTCQ